MNEVKKFFSEMRGMERFNWYVLKPVALVLVIVAFIIL